MYILNLFYVYFYIKINYLINRFKYNSNINLRINLNAIDTLIRYFYLY
jgi:hypothetical protein